MISKLLVAYDGSEKSKKALNLASEIAKLSNAELIILTVVNTCIETMGPPVNEYLSKLKEEANKKIDEAIQIAKNNGVIRVRGEVIEGEPSSVITEYAEKEGVDMIFIGNRGLSKLKKIFIGSVSQGVLELSKNPVVVVK
ncbi:universal stress protein [Saccharolobus caldissimus]|uniref:Universal stress protein UspA n=1 Tax=Saccharolobus caldissimus TaxID=1702097 RepID=A0AAQ4CWB2_9CREN|nr:universal stress protein [Saccharolobus caldissimus]BDC00094.1 universal stress protein UspA [Saccharolobus caldissimus]